MGEFGRVLFMRHPETEGNVRQFLSGRRDVALSAKGALQAERGAEAIVAWRPDRIVSSPLSRCRAIADRAASVLGLDVVVDERLIEIDFGSVEGLTRRDLAERGLAFPWQIEGGISRPAPGAESFEHLIARARDFVSDAATWEGKSACITHGGLSRALLAAVYDIPVDTFWNRVIPNVSSQVFVSDGTSLALQSAGLTPEELKARAVRGFVPGDSVTKTASPAADDEADDLISHERSDA